MSKVSAFWPVQIGHFEYLFFVVNWNDFSNAITESLERNLDTLGQEIGLQGKVVQAYKGVRWETYQEVKGKEGWPYDVHARFDSEQYPFMLVIDSDFKQFDPQEDKWAVVWFSDFRENPDSISEIFGALVKKIRHDDGLFDYFKGLGGGVRPLGCVHCWRWGRHIRRSSTWSPGMPVVAGGAGRSSFGPAWSAANWDGCVSQDRYAQRPHEGRFRPLADLCRMRPSRIDRASAIISKMICPAGLTLRMDPTPSPAGRPISSKSPVVSGVGTTALNLGMV